MWASVLMAVVVAPDALQLVLPVSHPPTVPAASLATTSPTITVSAVLLSSLAVCSALRHSVSPADSRVDSSSM